MTEVTVSNKITFERILPFKRRMADNYCRYKLLRRQPLRAVTLTLTRAIVLSKSVQDE